MTTRSLTEQLVRTELHTDEAGRAIAEISGEPYREDGTLYVPLELLTTGERTVEQFEIPPVWTDEYALVRLLSSFGYGAGGVDLLVGERVPVEPDGEGWSIALERPERTTGPDGESPTGSAPSSTQHTVRARPGLAGRSTPPTVSRELGRYVWAAVLFLGIVTVGSLFAATALSLAFAMVPSSPLALMLLLFLLLAASHPRPHPTPHAHHSLIPVSDRRDDRYDPRRR